MQMTELALYDVTESCPVPFTQQCIQLTVYRINCAFSLQYIGGTYQLHKLCGGNLNWTIHYIGNYN